MKTKTCIICHKKMPTRKGFLRGPTAITCSDACYHTNRMNLQAKRRLTSKHLSVSNHPSLDLRDSTVRKGRKTLKLASLRKRKLAFELSETGHGSESIRMQILNKLQKKLGRGRKIKDVVATKT